MSGYLTRMAARAVAGPGLAGPRLPSRFELAPSELSDLTPDADTGRALTDTASEDSPTWPRARADLPPTTPEPALMAVPPAASSSSVLSSSDRRDPVVATRRSRTALGPLPHENEPETGDRRSGGEPMHQQLQQPVEALRSAHDPAAERAASGMRGAVLAAPMLARAVPPEHAGNTGHAGTAEQVVQITIGRVEVRATVAPPPALVPPAKQQGAVPEPLSLRDYLNGRRESR